MEKNKHIITYGSSKMILYAAAVVIVSLTVGFTLAYLAAKDAATNTIFIDKGVISIKENFSQPSTLKLENVTQKVVKVHNNSDTPCFVRVYVDFSDSEIRKRSLVCNDESVNGGIHLSTATFLTWDQFTNTETPQTIAPKWVYVKDDDCKELNGYFYYTEKVGVGENGDTDPLFRWVMTEYGKKSANGDTESYLTSTNSADFISGFEIIVYSESVQTVDMGTEFKDEDYLKAWKYFLTKDRTP